MWLWALRVALALALVAAVSLARRHATYRPIAVFLAWVGFAHVVRPLLQVFVLAPARAAGRLPYIGLERALYHLGEQALFISYPIGIVALALWAFRGVRPWFAVVAWVVVVVGIAAAYPELRQAKLYSAYLAITLTSILVSVGAAAAWWRSSARPSPPQIAVLLLIGCEIGAVLLGPYAAGQVFKYWPINQGLYAGLYVILFGLEVAWSRR